MFIIKIVFFSGYSLVNKYHIVQTPQIVQREFRMQLDKSDRSAYDSDMPDEERFFLSPLIEFKN